MDVFHVDFVIPGYEVEREDFAGFVFEFSLQIDGGEAVVMVITPGR